MQESVSLEDLNGRRIDAHVRVRVDGTVFVLYKNDKGQQIRTNYSPAEHTRKFGHFVKIPVKDLKHKTRHIDVCLSLLYKQAFPNKTLPSCLQAGPYAMRDSEWPQQDTTQLKLF